MQLASGDAGRLTEDGESILGEPRSEAIRAAK